jgi:hypothetical protein
VAVADLTTRYEDRIAGVLSCYDRVVIYGTLPGLCFAEGMARHLGAQGIRLFDYPRWAEPLRDEIRQNAERLAADYGIVIEYVRRKHVRKEDLVAKVLAQRGEAPGLVHIISAMEACQTYKPWHDKSTGRTFLRPAQGQCLHYYFYFIDPEFGLCYLRVPTWSPFRLQFYFNGHNWLAAQLRHRGIGFTMRDNAFTAIADWQHAQRLADQLEVARLHRALDRLARRYCPVVTRLQLTYHWSIMQCEYATDVVFRRQGDLEPIYDTLVHTAIHAVKPDHVATFLGRRLTDSYPDELGNDFSTRIEGTRIKHHMGAAAIKMYDKFGLVLRIETTANDVTFFKHHRKVEQRDGTAAYKLAPVRKTIYSLAPDLRQLLGAANQRYLDFLSDLDDPSAGIKAAHTLARAAIDANGKTHRGFNLFLPDDEAALRSLLRGEVTISGLRHADLRRHLPGKSPSQISSLLKRLRTHGVIRRIGKTYKYYLTTFGRRAALTGLKLKELLVIPALAATAP